MLVPDNGESVVSSVVDMVRRSWNRLEVLVREWAESIRGLPRAENGSLAA